MLTTGGTVRKLFCIKARAKTATCTAKEEAAAKNERLNALFDLSAAPEPETVPPAPEFASNFGKFIWQEAAPSPLYQEMRRGFSLFFAALSFSIYILPEKERLSQFRRCFCYTIFFSLYEFFISQSSMFTRVNERLILREQRKKRQMDITFAKIILNYGVKETFYNIQKYINFKPYFQL